MTHNQTPFTRWLVLSGPLSGYMIELFNEVERVSPVRVDYLYSPIPAVGAFSHESNPLPLKGKPWNAVNVLQIANAVQAPAPDVVFMLGTRPTRKMAAALAFLPASVPVVFASDENILAGHTANWKKRLVYAALTSRVKNALSLGQTNGSALRQLGFRNVLETPIYAVDFEAFHGPDASAPPRSRPRVLIVSRLVVEKNLVEFLAAFSKSSLSGSVDVDIVGEGPLRPELERLTAANGLTNVRLLGARSRPEVAIEMGCSDILVLPSVYEPWGIVVVEALGSGLPVVASPVVGAAASLHDGGVVLADNSSGDAIARALEWAVSNLVELQRKALDGRDSIRAHYSKATVAADLVRLASSNNFI